MNNSCLPFGHTSLAKHYIVLGLPLVLLASHQIPLFDPLSVLLEILVSIDLISIKLTCYLPFQPLLSDWKFHWIRSFFRFAVYGFPTVIVGLLRLSEKLL